MKFIRIKVYRSYQRDGSGWILDFFLIEIGVLVYCLSIRERHLFFTLSLFAT